MKNKFVSTLLLIGLLLSVFSCEKDEPMENEERIEVTDIRYTLISPNGDEQVLTYSDPDGRGGNDPVVTGATIQPNVVYFGNFEISNELSTPTEDIKATIEANKREYQFFYIVNGLDMTIAYADSDDDQNPVGLTTALMIGNSSNGTLTINLQEDPNKSGAGVSDGQIGNAGGATIFQASFPITIQ